jgi:GntR family transcriptional regulator
MLTINYKDPRPIYEQVRDALRQLILSGAIAPAEKLPSVRELAGQLAINPNTIQRAYRELEAEGYIVSVPGKGSFVARGGGARAARRRELTERLRALASELEALGMTRDEIAAIIKEEEHD